MIGDPPGVPSRGFGSSPSFFDLVRAGDGSIPIRIPESASLPAPVPHGTTVVALKYADGVVMAGDRRAVEGYTIADRRMEKVYQADEHSTVGIAGVAAQALELVRLFQTELEHYEKVEGETLSMEGKANRLAQLLRASMQLVFQGLVVVPVYGGFDIKREEGRIFRYDVIGGKYEEADFHATGSGSVHARGSMKKRWRRDLDRQGAIEVAVEGLLDASEEDTATGGPDALREIYPTVFVIDRDGVQEIDQEDVGRAYRAVMERREPLPGGQTGPTGEPR